MADIGKPIETFEVTPRPESLPLPQTVPPMPAPATTPVVEPDLVPA